MLRSLGFEALIALVTSVAGFVLAVATTERDVLVPLVANEPGTETSLTLLLLLLAAILGFVITALGYRRNNPEEVLVRDNHEIVIPARSRWLARLVTAITSGLLLMTVTAVVLYLLNLFTPGLTLNQLTIVLTVTLYSAVLGFALAYWSSNIDAMNLLFLAALSAVSGIVLAAIAVGDPLWWQRSLSYLGSTETAGIYFNIGMILTGLLILAVDQETIAILRALAGEQVSQDYVRAAGFFLIAIPICAMGVGLFPTRITPLSDFLHNVSSHLMLVFFLIMMFFTVNRQNFFHSNSFRQMSRVFAVAILIIFFLFVLEVVNFVAFELIIFVPVGVWLVLYQNQVRDLAYCGAPVEVSVPRAQSPLAVYAVRVGAVCLVLGTIVGYVATSGTNSISFIELGQRLTVANILLVLALVIGVGATAIAYRRFVLEAPELSAAERMALENRGLWLGRTVIAVTAGLITVVITIVVILIWDLLFPNVVYTTFDVMMILAVYCGALGLALAYWAGTLDDVNMLILAGITIVLGIILAALFMGDPEWWRVSLSYLGSTASPAQGFFNFGMLFTGLIMLIVNLDTIGLLHVLRDDGQVSPDFLLIVRWLLILIPLGLVAVGVFPRRMNPLYDVLHNLCATLMVLFYMVLALVVVARKDTIYTPEFIRRSRLLAAAVPILFVVYILEIVNYVGFELLLFIPIGLWLLLFQLETRQFARSDSQAPDSDQVASNPAT